MKDGFSTQIHIRQNDIGQFGKSGQDAVQKIVIFPTCILQIVYRVFVENFFLRQNRGISTQQPGKADAGRQNISAKKRKRSSAPRTEKLLQDADKKR